METRVRESTENEAKTEVQHTPLPWEVRTKAQYGTFCYEGGNDHATITGDYLYLAAIKQRRDLAEANAAYIVQACNAYPAMIDLLRSFIVYAEDTCPDCGNAEAVTLIERARAAISLTEREES